jgi:hypothetical protein
MGPTPSQKNSQFVVLTTLPKTFNNLGIGPLSFAAWRLRREPLTLR